MFNKLLKREKKQGKEDAKREQECMTALMAVLKSYNCTIRPILRGDVDRIYADMELIALPTPTDGPTPTEQPVATAATVTADQAAEIEASTGQTVDPSKIRQ